MFGRPFPSLSSLLDSSFRLRLPLRFFFPYLLLLTLPVFSSYCPFFPSFLLNPLLFHHSGRPPSLFCRHRRLGFPFLFPSSHSAFVFLTIFLTVFLTIFLTLPLLAHPHPVRPATFTSFLFLTTLFPTPFPSCSPPPLASFRFSILLSLRFFPLPLEISFLFPPLSLTQLFFPLPSSSFSFLLFPTALCSPSLHLLPAPAARLFSFLLSLFPTVFSLSISSLRVSSPPFFLSSVLPSFLLIMLNSFRSPSSKLPFFPSDILYSPHSFFTLELTYNIPNLHTNT